MAERNSAVDILDKPTCAGGNVKVRAIDCISRQAVFTTTEEGEVTITVPASSLAAPYLTSRYIARLQFADLASHFNEWRLSTDVAHILRGGGIVTATGYDLVNDLAAAGPIRSVAAGTGIPTFDVSVEATATELIDNYILPRLAAKGYTWIARGTVEFTEKRLWEWQRLNPLELLRYICSVRGHEYRLRRNGSTNYLIDVVETINESEPQREIRPGINLLDFTRTRKGASHFTALEGLGATQQDGQRATIARALWKVTAVDTGTKRLTLGDPSGVAGGPIVENNQYKHDGPAPGYVFRYNRGSVHRIVASFVGTQQVELDLVDSYVIGDLVELRSTAGASSISSEIPDGWTLGSSLGWTGKRVTNVDTGNKRLTVDNPFTASADPVVLDDRYRGWIARAYFRSASSLMTADVASGTNRQCTVGSTTGMQAGDLVYHTSSNPTGAPSWTLSSQATYEVVSVDSSTLVTIKFRRKTGAVPSLGTGYLSTWRARTPDRICSACAGSGNTVDLDSVASIANDDLVELVRRYDGAVQTELASPTGVALHGIRLGSFERGSRGELNLLAPFNAYFRNWTAGAAAPPDSWFASANMKAFGTKNTNATYLKTGVFSVRLASIGQTRFAADISAGATSATMTAIGGSRYEVGESVILSVGLGNAETVVLTSVSADGLTIGFAACANGHLTNEDIRSIALTPDSLRPSNTLPGYVLVSELLDCPAMPGLATFGVRVPLYLKGLVTTDQAQVKISTTSHPELGGTAQSAQITLSPNTGAVSNSWNDVWVPISGAVAGSQLRIEIGFNPASQAYPSDKAVYVGAVGLFQTSYDPQAIPEYSFATELHQATNAKLALVAQGAPASYDMGVVDLYGLDPTQWPYLQLIPGVIARTTERAVSVAGAPLRLLKLRVDYDEPAQAHIEVGTKQQRLTEIIANASVPVPIVKINSDGSTQVLTATSRQQLAFPTIGSTPPPSVTELFETNSA